MNDKRYRYILYTITLVIIATIGIQIYWNYKNYLVNKQQLVNDVQVSLDKAVDDYYADLAKQTTIAFSFDGISQKDAFKEGSQFSEILKTIDKTNEKFKNLNSINTDSIEGIRIFRGSSIDSLMHTTDKADGDINISPTEVVKGKATYSNVRINDVASLTQKVFISIQNDTLDIRKVDSILKIDLLRKNITADYDLSYKTHKHAKGDIRLINSRYTDTTESKSDSIGSWKLSYGLTAYSKSSLLPRDKELQINFTNETKAVLQRMLGGISISTLLVLAVISCLFYLLKIIKHQKQLAEVKNDLISNITHEFKTPIATISVALESITNFNSIEDKEKTKKYINMSSNQLSKLNIMVEKLLETATLDSDSLELNKEEIDIVHLLTTLCNKYQIHNTEKTIQTYFKIETLVSKIDVFHFENAINNILDNAIKYGGNIITIDLSPKNEGFEITISDNGTGITKANKDRIFEKFYRVPKGNTHDVKGFGIGLYYTKTIIDKHNGTIALDLNNALTTFKINMPNG
ncbi:sensor histidine kinase [Winogradskyella immobilis]|uniref:histidine kinase n=1 Tax=Winogradskyella immobilis TaxID=2816852 RepID=A0ABS8EL63_9FLAO|nr:HAMP domain-containing sensor histidine kinase [Winogradskyella immobilis]MCC1483825.1 HAMP domain-containing histidine kinase [Winogradskyella immobilis]MCG0015919.1 HAMP domain-containing histidine kinase [Winogradskyella immobilis]